MLMKLKAWDELNKVMHHDFEFITSGNEENDWIIFKSDKQRLQDGKVFENPYTRQQFKIMRYTGLHDKNGKEIYEGDYIKTPVGMWEKYEIKFKSGCYVADYKGHFKFLYECKNAEIIGNIYDNPELLEVGE